MKSIRISDSSYLKIKEAAGRRGHSITYMIDRAIDRYLGPSAENQIVSSATTLAKPKGQAGQR